MSDTAIRAVILVLVLVLPMSALLARRVPWRTTLLYSAIWLAVAATLALVLNFFT